MTFRLALITGATSGIGEALAKLLASKKTPLILTGRNEKILASLKEELGKQVAVTTIQSDLSSIRDRALLVHQIESHVPDLVINNAGFGLYGDALSHPIAEQLNMLEVDGAAYLELTLAAAQALRKAQKGGVILNVSSAAAFQIMPGLAVYAASKAFVNSFSQALDFELKKWGIRVLSSCPGYVTTGFAKRAAGRPIKPKKKLGSMTPEFAAEEIFRQIEKGKRLHIFDWKFRLATWFSYLVPKALSAKVVYSDILDRVKSSEKN